MKSLTTKDYLHISVVAAIYIVLTILPPLNAISFGAYQFRVSEMLNFLGFYNKKYIIAVTIGCMISNLYSFGVIDVFVGGFSTLIFVTLGIILFKKYQNDYLLNGIISKGFLYFSVFFAASMITIALELHYLFGAPFWLTWFTTGVGELLSLLVGAVIIEKISKTIDFTK
ncbi:QueT transporter family protein [Streptococcus zalophi]|uniref:QueT transporter family protein n=1 Tax=Streptococcus zalophi TaxID=640031 RepID=A0A934P9Z2_9STRE|nr:QueT transporter family protein [Streptococcus zalophi]MBJ8349588.1 QueT transporter family protein [Streptococcus zalophi]